MTENHPDLITEGFAQSGQRLVQVISLAAIVRQAHARRRQRLSDARAAKDAAEERRITNEIRAASEQARSQWAPAHDHQWLRQADLLQVARAMGGGTPYAENSPAAMHAYTIPVWLILPAALFILVLAFIGPTLVAIIRKVDGLGEFMLYNAVCFVMPVGLIVIWVMAFIWPRREPPMRYTTYPPPLRLEERPELVIRKRGLQRFGRRGRSAGSGLGRVAVWRWRRWQ